MFQDIPPPRRVQPRENWLDWARTFAIISIVFCHTTEAVFQLNIHGYNQASQIDKILGLTFFTFGRLGVPVFLFLTGYLVISRCSCCGLKDVISFIKRRWLPLFMCYEIWIILYNIFIYVFHDNYFAWHNQTLKVFFYEIILKAQPPMPHLWYMPMIVVMYLAIPAVALIKDRLGEKAFYLAFAALIALSFRSSNASYLTYICFGYICYDLNIKHASAKNLLILLALAIAAVAYVVAMQVGDYERGMVHNVWYTEKPLMYATAALFPCFALLNKFRLTAVEELSKSAFAIYLLHFPCMLFILNPIKGLGLTSSITAIVLFVCTFALAYGVFRVVAINKPTAKRIFLYK